MQVGISYMAERSSAARGGPIPPIIKWNTLLLALTQAFVGVGTQMVPTMGAIIITQMVGSAYLVGLAASLQNVSRFLIAYPIGWIADTLGRRVALWFGHTLCTAGALTIGTSVLWTSLPLFIVGMLLMGLGVGAGQQLRLAAADLYPPARRAEGLGYVLTGSLVGALGGPVLISFAQQISPSFAMDPLALSWFLMPAVMIPSMLLVLGIRPDPREIATNLRQYYPDLHEEPKLRADAPSGTGPRAWLRHYPLQVAFVAGFAAQGVMTLMMAMTSLALAHHGHDLPMISLAVAIHVVGMFGLSLPIGRLTDRIGRRWMMMVGTWVSAVGGLFVAMGVDYWAVTLGTALVGVGWCCTNVASTALIADLVPARDRGRAIGTNDSFANAGSIFLPLLGGPVVELFGLPSLAIISTGLLLLPLMMLLRLDETARQPLPQAVQAPQKLHA
jgi:MFS family permease